MVDNSRICSNTCSHLVAARKGEHTCETHGGKGIRVCDPLAGTECTRIPKLPSPIWDRDPTADGARQRNRRFTRLTSCGKMKHRHPFPPFEIRTSKSTTYLDMSHTDGLFEPVAVR